jgi:hypothetical protein
VVTLQELPGWAEFAPQQPDVPPTPTGPAEPLPAEVANVREIEEDGSVTEIPDVTFACTTTPYTLRRTPARIVSLRSLRMALYQRTAVDLGRRHGINT